MNYDNLEVLHFCGGHFVLANLGGGSRRANALVYAQQLGPFSESHK